MRSGAIIALALVAALHPVRAQTPRRTWAEEKCFRYQRDWSEALRRFGRAGVSEHFIARNEAFIASGCSERSKICAQSAEERKLVDVLAMRIVSESMSTTFLPFDCPE